MPRSLSDNITAFFKVVFSPFAGKSNPLDGRIASTKMTHSRLKALETPDYLKEKHAQVNSADESTESKDFQLYTSEEEVSKRVKSMADMSQYRLAALAKNLPHDGQDKPRSH